MLRRLGFCTRISAVLFMLAHLPMLLFAADSTFDLSLEELMTVEVTSASKKPQSLKDIPAAVHIINADDIRKSGATNIPEALRLAPGVHVMALSHNRWAVSIRGAAREYSNKLLVLVDGRSVYMPVFSGVMWEALDVPLENIQRIEVIRGPGASVWGANAVNGVINIITLSAADTQGGRLNLAAGSELKDSAFLRYGYRNSEATAVRFHARGFEYDQSRQINGKPGEDAWTNRSAGFRIDRNCSGEKFMLQGNAFLSKADDLLTMFSSPPQVNNVMYTQRKQGVDLSARWDFDGRNDRKRSFQASFENSQLHHIYIDENRRTLDLEYTEQLLNLKSEVVWGVSSRLTWDTIDSSRYMWLSEREKMSGLYRFFINDDIEIRPDKLHLFLSAGLEHNNISGIEFQPDIRLMATPDKKNSIWLAWSKASRTPSRVESGAGYYAYADPAAPLPIVVRVALDDVTAEKLDSFDMGWRRMISDQLNFDLSGFYFKYDDCFGSNISTLDLNPAGYLVVNQKLNNSNRADFRGLELVVDWQPHDKWQLNLVYSYININLALPAGSIVADVSKNVPERTYSMFSKLQLSKNLNWDFWFRHSGSNECGQYGPIPGYDIFDTQLSWKAKKNLDLSFVAQNLFDKKHQEFLPEVLFSSQREFGRRVYFKAEWGF